MPRPATGQVIDKSTARGRVFALRFRAYGRREYVRLGTTEDGWSRDRAQIELENILADVRRGRWRPAESAVPDEPREMPSFHEFASEWFEATKGEWRPKTQRDYQWQLSNHLLPFFKTHRLSQITIAEVDRYRHAQVRGTLSATSINKTITRLAQILEVAVEYGLIAANPAKGRRRRLKAVQAVPVWLDRAEQIEALLAAASDLDDRAETHGGQDQKGGLVYRRALLATLVFAGPRIGELTALRWRDLDLAGNRLSVRAAKSDAGVRRIDLLPALRDELAAYKARAPHPSPDGFVFATATGTELKYANFCRRVFKPAVQGANEKLAKAGEVPLPEGLTPHKLRHTFASILVALGVDAGVVMDQLGHTDPAFTLRVYRHGMRRDPTAKEHLRALVGGTHWAPMGTGASDGALAELMAVRSPTQNTAL